MESKQNIETKAVNQNEIKNNMQKKSFQPQEKDLINNFGNEEKSEVFHKPIEVEKPEEDDSTDPIMKLAKIMERMQVKDAEAKKQKEMEAKQQNPMFSQFNTNIFPMMSMMGGMNPMGNSMPNPMGINPMAFATFMGMQSGGGMQPNPMMMRNPMGGNMPFNPMMNPMAFATNVGLNNQSPSKNQALKPNFKPEKPMMAPTKKQTPSKPKVPPKPIPTEFDDLFDIANTKYSKPTKAQQTEAKISDQIENLDNPVPQPEKEFDNSSPLNELFTDKHEAPKVEQKQANPPPPKNEFEDLFG